MEEGWSTHQSHSKAADPRQQTPGASKPTFSAMWFNIFISKPFQSSRGGTNLLNSQSGGL